jgi:hypothetical protein
MPLTFRPARSTNARASLQEPPDEFEVTVEISGENPRRNATGVGAVLVQSNTAPEGRDILLSQARVRARRARGGTFEGGIDSIVERPAIHFWNVRRRREHRFD